MKAKKCIVHLNKIHFAVILVMLESFISSRDFQGRAVPGTVSMLMQTDVRTVEQTLTSIESLVPRAERREDGRKRGNEKERRKKVRKRKREGKGKTEDCLSLHC